jgi:hypothetical protein
MKDKASKAFSGNTLSGKTHLLSPTHLKPPTSPFKKEIEVSSHKRRKPNGKNKVMPVKEYTYYK